jgi:hypothetical protein
MTTLWGHRNAGATCGKYSAGSRWPESPTRTAALLHIGRQSLYQRLGRIESLLGLEIDDPDLLGELLGAACAHRVVRGMGADLAWGLRTVP